MKLYEILSSKVASFPKIKRSEKKFCETKIKDQKRWKKLEFASTLQKIKGATLIINIAINRIKWTVSRDFYTRFFMIQVYLGPLFICWSIFTYGFFFFRDCCMQNKTVEISVLNLRIDDLSDFKSTAATEYRQREESLAERGKLGIRITFFPPLFRHSHCNS